MAPGPAPADSYGGVSHHLFCCGFRSFLLYSSLRRCERSGEEPKAAAEDEPKPKGDVFEEGLGNVAGDYRTAPERGPTQTPQEQG